MPPTTEEFKKLIALGRILRDLSAQGSGAEGASQELLELLPGLRDVFGPAIPREAHVELDALEESVRSGVLSVEEAGLRAERISASLGLDFQRSAG